MNGKQATVGWLGFGLIVANLISGSLRPALLLITGNGTHNHGGGGGHFPSLVPGIPSGPIPGIPKIPNLPGPIPQGPVTGIPLSPISYTPPTQTNPGAVPTVWA